MVQNRRRKSFFVICVLTAILIMAMLPNVISADPSKVTFKEKIYNEYILEDLNSSIIVPETWTYLIEFSGANTHIFSTESAIGELKIQSVSGEEAVFEPKEFIEYVLKSADEGVSKKYQMTPIEDINYGIYPGACVIMKDELTNGLVIMLYSAYFITEDKAIILTIIDSEESFEKSYEVYERVLSSFYTGPKDKSIIASGLNFEPKLIEQWISVGYFASEGQGRTNAIKIPVNNWRVSYAIPEGKTLTLNVYEEKTKLRLKSQVLIGAGILDFNYGAGSFYFEITYNGAPEKWLINVEYLK